MRDQVKVGRVFRKLHDSPGALVIPNPWDVGPESFEGGVGGGRVRR